MVEDVGGVVVEVVDGKVTGGPVKNCIGVIGKTGLGSRVRDCKGGSVVKEDGKRYEVTSSSISLFGAQVDGISSFKDTTNLPPNLNKPPRTTGKHGLLPLRSQP